MTQRRYRRPAYSPAPEQRFAHSHDGAFAQMPAQLQSIRANDDDGGAMMKVAELVAFRARNAAPKMHEAAQWHTWRAADTVQVDAADEDRANGDDRQRAIAFRCPRVKNCAFVPAVQPGNAPQGARVDVPQVAGDVGGALERRVARR